MSGLMPASFRTDPKRAEFPLPKSPEEALAAFRLRPGLQVELVAAEPLIVDPVAIDWSADGKLWVFEMHDYPAGLEVGGTYGGAPITHTFPEWGSIVVEPSNAATFTAWASSEPQPQPSSRMTGEPLVNRSSRSILIRWPVNEFLCLSVRLQRSSASGRRTRPSLALFEIDL